MFHYFVLSITCRDADVLKVVPLEEQLIISVIPLACLSMVAHFLNHLNHFFILRMTV